MSFSSWILACGAAATGFIAAFWAHLRQLWAQLLSFAIITCEIEGGLMPAVTGYCWRKFSASPFGARNYVGWAVFVRPEKRVQLIAMEAVRNAGRLYWRGWKPLWVAEARSGSDKASMTNSEQRLRLSFLRGTFNADQLILDAVDEYNRLQSADDSSPDKRYRVWQLFGTAGKHPRMANPGVSDPEYNPSAVLQHRLLRWHPDDLGTGRISHGTALSRLALSREADAMVEEVRRWKRSEEWHKARGIPWRRGYLLHGRPGTGKTSLVRAIAEDFDLPVWVFNLASFHNDELQHSWQTMLRFVPCIALIEDIDAVFDCRENITEGGLTYDGLLNCLDGIERTDGVLLVLTTNNPDRLDPALLRPGRIDRVLEISGLDEAGRLKLCQRILCEWPETWTELVAAGDGETGAEFQERCVGEALRRYWLEQ